MGDPYKVIMKIELWQMVERNNSLANPPAFLTTLRIWSWKHMKDFESAVMWDLSLPKCDKGVESRLMCVTREQGEALWDRDEEILFLSPRGHLIGSSGKACGGALHIWVWLRWCRLHTRWLRMEMNWRKSWRDLAKKDSWGSPQGRWRNG